MEDKLYFSKNVSVKIRSFRVEILEIARAQDGVAECGSEVIPLLPPLGSTLYFFQDRVLHSPFGINCASPEPVFVYFLEKALYLLYQARTLHGSS